MSGGTGLDCTYAPGGWAVAAGPSALLLVNAADDPEAIASIWAAVTAGGSFDTLLTALARAGGMGIDDFVLLHRADGFSRAAVRGTAVLEIVEEGVGIKLRCPPGTRTWLETPLAGELQSVRMAIGDERPAEAPSLPLRAGVALAAEVVVRFGDAAVDAAAPAPPVAAPQLPPTPALSVAAPEPPPAPAPEPSAAPAEPPRSAVASPPADAAAPIEDDPTATLLGEVGGDISDYDFLMHSVARVPAEAAPVDVAPVPEPVPAPEPAPGPTPAPAPGPAPVPGPAEPPAAAAWQPPALISAVPGVVTDDRLVLPPPAAPAPAHAAPPAADLQHPVAAAGGANDHTVDLRTARELASRMAQHGFGPLVLSVRCPNDHLNPPHATQCRYPHCRAAITSTRTEDAPRPPLGVLRLTTGDTIVLDRDVILGRSPDEPIDDGPDSPHVIRLDSPSGAISRNHLRVTLDGWHVMVTDLRSMNGTEMAAPGQRPQQLRGGEAVPILPGTSVILAEDVTFVYEVE